MVGKAFTIRYIPAREDLNPLSVFRNPKHPQRVAVEECPSSIGRFYINYTINEESCFLEIY